MGELVGLGVVDGAVADRRRARAASAPPVRTVVARACRAGSAMRAFTRRARRSGLSFGSMPSDDEPVVRARAQPGLGQGAGRDGERRAAERAAGVVDAG